MSDASKLTRFLPPGYEGSNDVVGGFVAVLEMAKDTAENLADYLSIGTAEGKWLTLLARGYGVHRATGETDESLRERLRNVEDKLTKPSILTAVDAILAPYTATPSEMIEWFDGDATETVYLDSSYLDDARLLGEWNTFYLRVPVVGDVAWGDMFLGTGYLDDEHLGGGPEHPVFASIISEVERLRAAGVRWFLIIEG